MPNILLRTVVLIILVQPFVLQTQAWSQTLINPNQIQFSARFSSPPLNPRTNTLYLFTDAVSTGVCSGVGSALAWCAWNGFAYVTVASGVTPPVSSVFGRVGAISAQTGDYSYSQINGLGTAATHGFQLIINGVTCSLDGTCSITGTGAVTTVFGRSGTVTAQTGDYTAAKVTNAVDSTSTYADPPWLTALAYSKITGAPAIPSISGSTVLKGSGGNAVPATAGSDYVIPSGTVAFAGALSGTPTVCGSGLSAAGILSNGNATGCGNNQVILPITLSGCTCDGVADDTALVQAWLNTLVGSGPIPTNFTVSLAGRNVRILSTTQASPLTIPSRIHFVSPGALIGSPFSVTGGFPLPQSYISIQGALTGSPVSYGSVIAQNTNMFTASNSFTQNTMFLLSNFPYDSAHSNGTYPQGSDTPTIITTPVNFAIYPSATATTTGSASASSTTLTVASGSGTANGQFIAGVNIPASTTIVSGGGTTTWTISNATTGIIPGGSNINTYTTAAAAALNNNTNGDGPFNQRQYRKREVGLIRSSTGSAFVTMDPTAQAYTSTTALQFQAVNPINNVTFDSVVLQNLTINLDLTKDVAFRGVKLLSSTINVSRSLYATVDADYGDLPNCDCGVGVGASSRHVVIRGNYGNGAINTDNGAIRIDQAFDVSVDVNLGGESQSPAGFTNPSQEQMQAIIVDTGYAENPDGYTTGNDYNISIKAVVSSDPCAVGLVFFSNPWYSTIQNVSVDYTSMQIQRLTSSCNGAVIQMGGVIDGTVRVNDRYGTLYIQGTQNVKFTGTVHNFYSGGQLIDPLFGNPPQNNDNLEFNGFTTVSSATDGSTGTVPFYCHFCDNTKLSNITFDQRNYNNFVGYGDSSKPVWYGNVNWIMAGSAVPNFDCSAFTGSFHVLGDVHYAGAINFADCNLNHQSTYLETLTTEFGATIGDPTSSSNIVNIQRHVFNSTTWNPGSISNGTYATTTLSLFSVPQGAPVACGFSSLGTGFPGLTITASASSFGGVTVTLTNLSGGSYSVPSGTLSCQADVH